VTIRKHKVIYHLLEDLEELIDEFYGPEHEEKLIGAGSVKQVFTIDVGKKKIQTVAGMEVV